MSACQKGTIDGVCAYVHNVLILYIFELRKKSSCPHSFHKAAKVTLLLVTVHCGTWSHPPSQYVAGEVILVHCCHSYSSYSYSS